MMREVAVMHECNVAASLPQVFASALLTISNASPPVAIVSVALAASFTVEVPAAAGLTGSTALTYTFDRGDGLLLGPGHHGY